jgi:hypothetical protein
MGGHRPNYLNHLQVRRRGTDRTDRSRTVVLLPAARSLIPQGFQHQIVDVPPDHEVKLGVVIPETCCSAGHGYLRQPTLWRFTSRDQPQPEGSGTYRSPHEAAESCAVEAVEGPRARQRFDLDRWRRRRPSDN